MKLPHFGLHVTESGVALLAQEDGIQHTMDITLKFQIKVMKPRYTMICPHKINLSRCIDTAGPDDPLFNAMLPEGADTYGIEPYTLEDSATNRALVRRLFRLTSPNGPPSMAPLWMMREDYLLDLLLLTNVQPLVVYDYQDAHGARLHRLIESSLNAPRSLILMLPPLQCSIRPNQLRTKLSLEDLEGLPLEEMGASHLRRIMMQ